MDLTVTKAAAPPGEGGATRPRFQFDAKDGDDADAAQSQDRVMVEGLRTAAEVMSGSDFWWA